MSSAPAPAPASLRASSYYSASGAERREMNFSVFAERCARLTGARTHTCTDALVWQPHINEMKGIKVENQRVKPSAQAVGGDSRRESLSLLV